jgi:hypothetical protein
MKASIKTSACTVAILFVLLACGTKEQSEPHLNSNFKCISHIGMEKPLVAEEAEEVENVAALTNSKGKTHIHLDSIGGYCSSNIQIRTSCAADTLKLEEYWPEDGGRINSKCSCILSLDLTIDSIGDNFKYLVYHHEESTGLYQKIFPVIYK